MRFRTLLVIAITALVVAIVVPTLGAIALVLDRSARATLVDDLGRSQRVFTDLQAYRTSLFATNGRVVADEPRVKATVSSDSSRETVLGVARDLKRAVESDVFLLTDASGHLVVDAADAGAQGGDMSSNPIVRSALDGGEGAGIWTVAGQHAYQVQARRLDFGTTVVGVMAIGYEIDDRVAETVYRQTGSSVLVLLDGKPVAASRLDDRAMDRSAVAAAIAGRPLGEPTELALDGGRWLAQGDAFPGYRGAGSLRYVVLRSIDRALDARRRAVAALGLIASLGLLAALAIAAFISRRLSRPLDALVAFTGAVGKGELSRRAEVRGPVEIGHLGEALNRMVAELEESRRKQAERERLERELEIATRIQTSILPRDLRVAGVEVAARMLPADEVGGDYYDVLPLAGGARGAWIGIGDVAGHGLTAGLVMMMIQSVVSALVRATPDAAPRQLLSSLNAILYENIQTRLSQNEHVTLTLLRLAPDGSVRFAGAHEDLLVWRAARGACERIPTPGTWLGAMSDIDRFTSESELRLAPGDVVLLYTDGIIQAMNREGEQFGMERLEAELARGARGPTEEIVANLFHAVAQFSSERADDMTALALRFVGGAAGEAA